MHTAHWNTLMWFGIFSTLGMDVLLYLRHKWLRQPWFDYRVLGLALLKISLPQALKHAHAHTAASLLGWGLHYVIGVLLAVMAVSLAAHWNLSTLSLGFCLLFGMTTVVLPFCSMAAFARFGLCRQQNRPTLAQPWQITVHAHAVWIEPVLDRTVFLALKNTQAACEYFYRPLVWFKPLNTLL